ncbi:hypothetical protein [Gilliamella sp. wkB108]|uniref:hypothetical protein n=1 Tax=Gilliamella sp. wkB108 TaxID=3120256 RepID=UPI0009C053FA|nr:hypothetical protein [Gilliamella apicola]
MFLQKLAKVIIMFYSLFLVSSFGVCLPHSSNNILTLPIKSSQFSKYYKEVNHEIKLLPKYLKQAKVFKSHEIESNLEDDSWESDQFQGYIRYYEVGGFEFENYYYKLFIYNSYGESDTLVLNIEINSYDTQGNIVDNLILDKQYYYEDISCFTKFKINTDFTINLTNYVTYYYKVGYYGDEKGLIKNPKPQIYLKQKYKINQGHFELKDSKEFDL